MSKKTITLTSAALHDLIRGVVKETIEELAPPEPFGIHFDLSPAAMDRLIAYTRETDAQQADIALMQENLAALHKRHAEQHVAFDAAERENEATVKRLMADRDDWHRMYGQEAAERTRLVEERAAITQAIRAMDAVLTPYGNTLGLKTAWSRVAAFLPPDDAGGGERAAEEEAPQ